jgi:TolA-binding protein
VPGLTDTAASSPAPARPSTAGATVHRHPGPAATATTTTGGPTATGGVAAGQRLNDQGYALIRRGVYVAAVPLLRRAVTDLRGTGPADPYEAYANYNLGYALLQSGECSDSLPPLIVANRLETSALVDVAIRHAQACTPPGS